MDKRAAPRYDIALEVQLESPEARFRGITENISESGLLVQSWRTEPVGSLIDVQFPTFRGLTTDLILDRSIG